MLLGTHPWLRLAGRPQPHAAGRDRPAPPRVRRLIGARAVGAVSTRAIVGDGTGGNGVLSESSGLDHRGAMADPDNRGEAELAAGDFSSWLTDVQGAIRGERSSDVPCGGCTACCTSSQFVHIGPDETDVLAHIPAELLFPAPRQPPGHVLLGYDERGHCPMLIDDRCSIYEHRPRTCRTYDCRIFPAAGIRIGHEAPLIDQRARRWCFSFDTESDRDRQAAVEAAAAYLADGSEELPAAANATQRAVMAIEMHESFLGRDPETGRLTVRTVPDPARLPTEVVGPTSAPSVPRRRA